MGAIWWSLLPHLALESPAQEGSVRQSGLAALKVKLKAFYKANKPQSTINVKKLTLKWIKGKGAPKLRAKAGQASCLAPFTLELARDFAEADGALGQHRHQCMATLAGICSLAKQDVLTHADLTNWRRLSVEHLGFAYSGYSCSW